MNRYYGTITPTQASTKFTRKAWLAYIANVDDLARPEPRIGRNPANGQTITLQPPADTVHFTMGGEYVASFGWSQNNEPMIDVAFDDPHSDSAIRRAQEIAAALDADFAFDVFED